MKYQALHIYHYIEIIVLAFKDPYPIPKILG